MSDDPWEDPVGFRPEPSPATMEEVLDEVCGPLGQRGDRPTREIAAMVLHRLAELGYGVVMPPRRRPWLDTYLTESRLADGENQIPGEEGSDA